MVYVLMADGFEEVEAVTTVDILRRAGIDVRMVSVSENKHVTGGHQISVICDITWSQADFSTCEMLVLPGGSAGVDVLKRHAGVPGVINDFMTQNKWIAAICAAPTILAEMGLLEGAVAVCYPEMQNEMKGAVGSNRDVEIYQNIITSKAAGTSHKFAYKIVELLGSKEIADCVIEKMYYEMEC